MVGNMIDDSTKYELYYYYYYYICVYLSLYICIFSVSVLLSVRVCCNFMHIFGGHANRANAVQSGVKSKVVVSKCPPQVIVIVKQVRFAVEFFFCSRADVNLIRYIFVEPLVMTARIFLEGRTSRGRSHRFLVSPAHFGHASVHSWPRPQRGWGHGLVTVRWLQSLHTGATGSNVH